MKTSKKQFQEFQNRFRHYQKLFSIENYEVIFQHCLLEDNDAELEYFSGPQAAIVRLNTQINRGRSLDNLAKHEAIELLLSPCRKLAMSRNVSDDDINKTFHSLVQCLIRVA